MRNWSDAVDPRDACDGAVRGGPAVKYNDPLHPLRGKDQAAMLWEVKAKAPLVGPGCSTSSILA